MEFKIPTETVELPSKGLIYPEGHPLRSGTVEMKYMTAKEEDILTNQNYINKGIVVDKLLQSLLISEFEYGDLITGDKNAIMIAARILSYGKDYTVSLGGESLDIDLSTFEPKPLAEEIQAGSSEFTFELPHSKNEVTFKILTHADESKIDREISGLKKIDKSASPEITTRLKHMITSVNGSRETSDVRKFVDSYLLAKDARALREEYLRISPDMDLTVEYMDSEGVGQEATLPITINFFWPDA